MVKLIKALFGLILIGIVVGGLIAAAPYYILHKSVSSGVNYGFMKIEKTENLNAIISQNFIEDGRSKEDSYFWRLFHFKDYIIPFPVRHPNFRVIPNVKEKGRNVILGAKVLDLNDDELVTIELGKPYNLELFNLEDSLFNIPLVKNKILEKSIYQIWVDIHSLDFLKYGNLKYILNNISNISYEEVMYKLYILKMRQLYLGDKPVRIHFITSLQMAILKEKTTDMMDSGIRYEQVYMWKNNTIWPLKIKTLKNNRLSNAYRDYFFNRIQLKKSKPEDARILYGEFKALNYKQKLDEVGMLYLYSGWTHDIENKNYLKQMIRLLERGGKNKLHIISLYDFAFNKYGTNFSLNQRKETTAERINRKQAEEKGQDVLEEVNFEIFNRYIPDEEESLEFKLRKAKDNKAKKNKKRQRSLESNL